MQLVKCIAELFTSVHILDIAPSRRKTVLTVALLVADTRDEKTLKRLIKCRDLIIQGKLDVDSKLVEEVYRLAPVSIRHRILGSPVAQFVNTRTFRVMVLECVQQMRKNNSGLNMVLQNLRAYLGRHPSQARHYQGIIEEALGSKKPAIRAAGLALAVDFRIDTRQNTLDVENALRSRSWMERLGGVFGLARSIDIHGAELLRGEIEPDLWRSICERVVRMNRSDRSWRVREAALKLIQEFPWLADGPHNEDHQ